MYEQSVVIDLFISCYHIDDFAVDALTKYYKKNIKDGEGKFV
jgi:hypothetical protein